MDLGKDPSARFQTERRSDLLGGVLVLRLEGVALERSTSELSLYSRYSGASVKTRRVPLTMIPYYAWANRNATSMQVWTPVARPSKPAKPFMTEISFFGSSRFWRAKALVCFPREQGRIKGKILVHMFKARGLGTFILRQTKVLDRSHSDRVLQN